MRARTDQDCGFFRWANAEFSAWGKELLRDLRDTVWNLKKEVPMKEGELEEKDLQLVTKQIEGCRREEQGASCCFFPLPANVKG
ncbi:unnamed protein product [Urochloa humidicola]